MIRPVIAALALLLGGCLAPQDIDEVEPSRVENHAPRIVADQALVEGMPVTRLYVQNSCPPITFKLAAVEDLDLDDVLEVRFFVDYDQGCESCLEIQNPEPLRALPTGQAVRAPEFEFELRLPLDEGTHLVEAWVSDGFAHEEDALPPNRAVLEGRGVDTAVWVIEVQDAENQECMPVAS